MTQQRQAKRAHRNLVVFEAPVELTEKARWVAEQNMVSTSALCRQAVSQFIHRYEADAEAEKYSSF